jgi:hypothetical protein
VKEFFYSRHEEYFALAVADPSEAPGQIDFPFYWEDVQSPLLNISDFVDRDVWALGDFLPVEETFEGMSLDQRIAQWESESGEQWDGTQVFRAFKIRLDVFFSQEYEADIGAEEIGKSLVVDYSFGISTTSLLELNLDWSISCYAGSIEELESCNEQKHQALSGP